MKARLSADSLAVWQTAVQYHAWHALGILAVGVTGFHIEGNWLRAAGALLLAGIVLFSGSLYALALGVPKPVGMLTPLGGLAFILGWLCFAAGLISARTPV